MILVVVAAALAEAAGNGFRGVSLGAGSVGVVGIDVRLNDGEQAD